jgi:hypothetical protein
MARGETSQLDLTVLAADAGRAMSQANAGDARTAVEAFNAGGTTSLVDVQDAEIECPG